jgi:uncharacterized protein YgfB (UPF0149 family)
VLVLNELEFVNNTITQEGVATNKLYMYMKEYLTDECIDKLYVDNNIEKFLGDCVMFRNFQALDIYKRMKSKDEKDKFIESIWGLVRCKKTIDVADLKRDDIQALIGDVKNELADSKIDKSNISQIFSTVTKSVVNNKNLVNTLLSGDYQDVMKATQKTMEYMVHDPTKKQSKKTKKMMKKMKKMMDESADEKNDPVEMESAMKGIQNMVKSNPKLVESMFGGLSSGKMPDMSKMMNMEALMRNKDFQKIAKEMKGKLK